MISENVTAITTKNDCDAEHAPVVVDDQPRAIAQRGWGLRSRSSPRLAFGPRSGRDRAEFSSHDEIDDLLDVRLANEPLGRVAPLIENHDPVADHEQILQPVGDENDAHALGAHSSE